MQHPFSLVDILGNVDVLLAYAKEDKDEQELISGNAYPLQTPPLRTPRFLLEQQEEPHRVSVLFDCASCLPL